MTRGKMFLIAVAIPFLLLQTWWTFAPGIGIVDRYGFFNALTEYFVLNQGNSLLMAGLTDFMAVFPGLGFLLFFLFLNPDHRFVSDK